jgi:serine/threonine protein phosphatase PrpC
MAEISDTSALPGDGVLRKVFDLVHRSLVEHSKTSGFDLAMSGSTLTVCLLERESKRLVAAWAGDSRCAMGRPDGSGGVSLTHDHKPEIQAEKQRILASGGEVIRFDGDVPHRVFIKNQQLPGLAMSRAVGDCIAHNIGVIHVPDIVRYQVEDHCILCCSDGVWEFIESAEAVRIVGNMGRDRIWESTARLVDEARTRWLREENITDDISAICIYV